MARASGRAQPGKSFDSETESYYELLQRLNELPDPIGPRASRDEFTVLATPTGPGRKDGNSGTVGKPRKQRLRPPHEFREVVGIVGEIHAYRFLRHEFGTTTVTPDAWVSETRLRVLPLVAGESNNASDGHGYDFCVLHRRTRLHVKVKATIEEELEFDLGISKIEAANRLVRGRRQKWRILRVRNTLSSQPEFDWLPNPFEKDFKHHFRFHKGGMRVSYSRK